jgi:hypothetical protein
VQHKKIDSKQFFNTIALAADFQGVRQWRKSYWRNSGDPFSVAMDIFGRKDYEQQTYPIELNI